MRATLLTATIGDERNPLRRAGGAYLGQDFFRTAILDQFGDDQDVAGLDRISGDLGRIA